jgi:hypothetical protein
VGKGFAFDWPRYSRGKYAGAQKEAERDGRGMGGQLRRAVGLSGVHPEWWTAERVFG